jgi:ethanolamine ammonia-lyase small subunit
MNAAPDPWQQLRRLTTARIALGRAGGSLRTKELLDFRLAHARARDAVHAPFDAAAMAARLRFPDTSVLCLQSAARTQADFLRRPELGRKLSEASRAQLAAVPPTQPDVVLIISDGLSSLAATEHAPPLLEVLVPLLRERGLTLAPIIVVDHGRVAIQDEIGGQLGARLSLMLLGERPGLSAADSLGAYFTHAPRSGLRDSARNCISNIRSEGLSPADAARKLMHLIGESFRRGLSGVELKDDAPALAANSSRLQAPPA